jgi:hypothetical protein
LGNPPQFPALPIGVIAGVIAEIENIAIDTPKSVKGIAVSGTECPLIVPCFQVTTLEMINTKPS